MNRFAKYTLVCIATALLIAGLCSCKVKPDNSGSVDDDVIYSSNVEATLVLGEGVEEENLRILKNTYLKQTGKAIKIASFDSEAKAHEIVVGETSRAISKKAYRFLSTMEKGDEYVGYVIYSDGKSVAIAFDDAKYGVHAALTEAIETFVSSYMTSPSLTCKSGILARESFDAIDWQNTRDEKSLDTFWKLKNSQILKEVGNNEDIAEHTIEELKTLYDFLNPDFKTVVWLANLYDPETGGFYYSNSARNNEGYLPDLESTADALGLVKAILADYNGSLTDFFGKDIAERFISFAKDMQSADNGYFYHPQWPKAAVDAIDIRLSRDLMSALSILSDFGARPTYDTPNGVKGELGQGGVKTSSALVAPLEKTSAAVAVAAVSNEDDIYITPHLTSESNFKEYLSSLNSGARMLDSLKALNAQIPQIMFVDEELKKNGESYRLKDMLVGWITSKCDPDTNLWGPHETINSDSLEILYEVVSIHNRLGKELYQSGSYIEKIAYFIVVDMEKANINDLASSWIVISSISENLHLFSDSFTAETYLQEMYTRIPTLLENTRLKLAELLKIDGSFMTQTGKTDGMSNGVPVALVTADEGNVSATLAATKNIWFAIFKALNIGNVPVYMTSDRMIFQKTLLDMGVIIKNEVIPNEPIDFEDYEVGHPMPGAKLTFSEATTAIVESTDSEHGNVLRVKSNSASVIDTIDIKLLSAVKGSTCNIAELDICVLPDTANGPIFRLNLFNNMYLLSINVDGDTVMLHEDSYQYDSSFKHDLGARAKVGEWFNVRIEYYVGTRDTVRAKIFFNGECIAVTNHFFGKQIATAVPKSEYNYLRLETSRLKKVDILVDNVLAESHYRMYAPETNENGLLVRNVDAPEGNKTVYDFEETSVNSLPSGFIQSDGTAGVVSIDGNNQLSISSDVTELLLPLSERGTLTNSAVVEFDATVSEDSEVGSYFTLAFNEYLLNNTNLVGFRLVVCEDALGKYLTVKECIDGKEGATYDSVRLPLGESFKLRIQVFCDEMLALLTINNAIIGANSNVSTTFAKRYLGEVALSSSKKAGTLLLDNLVCERIVGNYEATVTPSIDRVTHECDTLAGIASSGVELSNGAISFESAQNNSYIRVPVNERAGNGRLGIVSLSVLKTATSKEDLIISFTDKAGNKIASFALHATDDTVELHEYTENGRYAKSIYSVKSSDFTLGIEYNIVSGDFNVLVNGNYVVSTSVMYSAQSGQYRFEQLEVSSNGKAPFLVDNLVVETSLNLFTIPTYKTQNKDNLAEVITYENSSFADMTTFINTANLVTPEAKIRVREGIVKGKVSRVLEYTSGASAQDILAVTKWSKPLDGANAVAFETDIMIAPETKTFRFTITLKPKDSTACTIYLWSRDGKIMINSSLLENKDTYLDIEDGEWFNVRVEYTDTQYDYDYDGKADVIVRVYINGELVASGIKPDYPNNILSASTVNIVRLDVASGSSGKVYLDNTKFEQFNMSYEPPLPPDSHTLTFEPGVINESIKRSISRASSLSVAKVTVAGEIARVLRLVSVDKSNDKLGILVTQSLEGANAISFETDIMIMPTSNIAEITLEPVNANGRQPFSLALIAEKDGAVKLSANGLSETVIGNSGEWIHLKIEYMNPVLDYDGDGDRDILLKIYVDNSPSPIVVYTPYNSTSYYTPTKLSSFNIGVSSSSVAEVLLDNIKYWQVERTPDDGGVPPVEKEYETIGGGSNSLDKDGWA